MAVGEPAVNLPGSLRGLNHLTLILEAIFQYSFPECHPMNSKLVGGVNGFNPFETYVQVKLDYFSNFRAENNTYLIGNQQPEKRSGHLNI